MLPPRLLAALLLASAAAANHFAATRTRGRWGEGECRGRDSGLNATSRAVTKFCEDIKTLCQEDV